MKMDLPIKPFSVENAPGLSHNVVRLSLSYDKSVKGPVLNLQAASQEPSDGSGFDCFKVALFASPSARVVLERGWKMNNAKRLGASWDQVVAEITSQRGDSYAALEKLLTEAGSGLAVV